MDALFSEYDRKLIEIGMLIHQIGGGVFERRYQEALRQEPKLALCDAESFSGGLLQMIQLGLTVEHIHLDPVCKADGWECVFRLKREGLVELSRRCGKEPEGGATA
jgi:recombinational DNA repair protein RecT